MRVPLSWLREFTPLDAPPVEIADALNQLGLEVEAVEAPGEEIRGVVAARVLDVVPHPDADKIRLADVDFGTGQTRVVCGAPNIYPGMVAPFATVGAQLPGGFEITKRKIRGVVSEGMLCSGRELGLSDDHSGILELPSDTVLGTDAREVLGLDDVVFDLSITPNRPDAMGITGVARELAAHFGLPLDIPVPDGAPNVDAIGDVTVQVEAPGRCPRFVARVARITMGESPEWMQRRLRLAGMRPISNVVDVTNYVMLERCRPLHAFDLGRLAGRGIVVRLARDGETMTTLDGVERHLTSEDLLICDAQRVPQSIAGIMGGADAEVDDTTTEILIESAYFEPSGIALTSKRLGLRSEASARFERGIDPNGTAVGADYAIRLLGEVASADAEPAMIDRYPHPVERQRITLRTTRVNAILGTEFSSTTVRGLLEPLGIECTDAGADGSITAVCPTWRPDLEREIDLVEEVGRRHGLNRIARTVPTNPGRVGRLTPRQRERRLVADVLVGAGYAEGMTLPLLSPADLRRAGIGDTAVIEVENPLRADESVLRPSVMPGLLKAVQYNASHGNLDIALFELGTVFFPPAADDGASRPRFDGVFRGDSALLPDEHEHVGAIRAGVVPGRPFEPDRAVEPADTVAAIEALAAALRLADLRVEAAELAGYHPTRAARVLVDGISVGAVGEVAPDVLAAHDLDVAVSALEIDVDLLLAGTRRDDEYEPVSRFPASSVDLAFVIPDDLPAGAVAATLHAAAGELLEDIRLFDVFRSDAFGPGRRSVAFTVRFRAPDHTLTDDEVATLRRRCIDAVVGEHGAELRS
ncbi:MAG: phenylalanyl-tRNA synthetase beta subunit [Actinomycetia bacterium]|nr:phenylalanyl-tRNA synthetase beta subunit [Actinomycetes bacterium]